MKCDFCNIREAVIFIQQISAGTKNEVHLCTECARSRGVSAHGDKLEMSFSPLFAEIAALRRSDESVSRLCPVCGQSLAQLQKTGRAGCPECYGIFGEHIRRLFLSKNISEPYSGSLPKRLAHFRSALTDRMRLRTMMEESAAKEDYEKAAIYRDRLKALEKCAVADGADSGSGGDIPDGENNEASS